jgi:hypothetical protein
MATDDPPCDPATIALPNAANASKSRRFNPDVSLMLVPIFMSREQEVVRFTRCEPVISGHARVSVVFGLAQLPRLLNEQPVFNIRRDLSRRCHAEAMAARQTFMNQHFRHATEIGVSSE